MKLVHIKVSKLFGNLREKAFLALVPCRTAVLNVLSIVGHIVHPSSVPQYMKDICL